MSYAFVSILLELLVCVNNSAVMRILYLAVQLITVSLHWMCIMLENYIFYHSWSDVALMDRDGR